MVNTGTSAQSKKNICILYTGGTIGMEPDEFGVLQPPRNVITYERIAPEITTLATITSAVLLNKDSTNMHPKNWRAIAEALYERLKEKDASGKDIYDGFVVLHGTDTMHFTSTAVAFAMGPNLNKPIVFTGAQTNPAVPHGDARINLTRAVKVACESDADRPDLPSIAEVVIAFGDYVYRACRTQKCDERRFKAFESPALFPIADITERILVHDVKKARQKPAPIDFRPNFDGKIIQITLTPGSEPGLLEPLLDNPALDGIVLLSFGAGNVPDGSGDNPNDPAHSIYESQYDFRPFIKRAIERNKAIIIASQFPANSTMESHYAPGQHAIRSGAIPTGNMTNAAAVVKLHWAFAQVADQIRLGHIRQDQRLSKLAEIMAKPHVNEVDAF